MMYDHLVIWNPPKEIMVSGQVVSNILMFRENTDIAPGSVLVVLIESKSHGDH